MSASKKSRLDRELLSRGLAPTLEAARALIMAGRVIAGDHLADKPAIPVSSGTPIRLRSEPCPYVSRGGLKLDRPLDEFSIPVRGATVLDVGASTGGFTDCLLQRGAAKVFAVDVGYGQLAWKLQTDSRVVRLDRTNITALRPGDLEPAPDLAVIDASFTSLRRLLDGVLGLLRPGGWLVCLVKPQFEAPRGSVEKGGVVKSETGFQQSIRDVALGMIESGVFITGIIESPIRGSRGNREFFICAKKGEAEAGRRHCS